jgi:hypothetical protein
MRCALLLMAFVAAPLRADAPVPVGGMKELVRMDRCQLDALYRQSDVGCPPSGVLRGRAIINAGSPITVPASRVIHVLWQGKVVRGDDMVNRVFGGLRAVHARVYIGESWVDGKPALVMDYAGASRLFGEYRDEVREVSPGVWLGVTHKRTPTGPEFKTYFSLEPKK